ncbi:hypothetical protein [Chitinasiproducens palmae]|uniref:hypothetical protein n=1 Tax=Chitinasiproducens palmae TaxID=1770053 RepID=UPI001113A38A|nr:hypothetical protein [Chitinasiproducens palmae]
MAGSAASAGPGSDPAASRALSGAPVEARLTHNYVLARDGEYGYEAADKQRIVMVRYLGEKRGVYTAEIQKGDAVGQMSCRAPCDQILTRYFVGGKQTRAEKTRNDGVSIGAAIFADAMAGQLRTYGEQSAAR